MDKDAFWKIISRSRRRFDASRVDGNMDLQCEDLAQDLRTLSPEDVAAFDEQFGHRMFESFRWDLWGAAYLIGGGCSDDGFDYFQRWLISMGREVFEAALRDPDSLANVAWSPGIETTQFEDFGYVAGTVYEELTDEESPASWRWPDGGPVGTRFSTEDTELARTYPRLWASPIVVVRRRRRGAGA